VSGNVPNQDAEVSLLESLSYFVVQLLPTVLVLGLAWTVIRAVGVSVIWREDE
jgi:hypothetical protein